MVVPGDVSRGSGLDAPLQTLSHRLNRPEKENGWNSRLESELIKQFLFPQTNTRAGPNQARDCGMNVQPLPASRSDHNSTIDHVNRQTAGHCGTSWGQQSHVLLYI